MTAEQRIALVDGIAALRYRAQVAINHGFGESLTVKDWKNSAHTLERMLLADPALPAPRAHR